METRAFFLENFFKNLDSGSKKLFFGEFNKNVLCLKHEASLMLSSLWINLIHFLSSFIENITFGVYGHSKGSIEGTQSFSGPV